ncbi:hypothetical protein, partial [Klebsiella pneumoniae]|uniref:hypothetical protein n=1 Tax=Klebsiella pneumoniae TaxID=573 RepID=UPI001C8FA2E9
YTPSTAEAGTTYYRCVVTNTKDGKTATATSVAAEILVKVLSRKASLNVGASVSNSLTSDTFMAGSVLATGVVEIVGVVNYNQEKFGTLYFGA